MPRTFGRYRIEDCLGRGGMGAVFRAHDTQLDRTVALKVPFLGDDGEETRQRFFREARAAATLHHANICPVYDVGEELGLPYLTMAFIQGRPLAKVLKDGPPVEPVQAALLVRKLALAMQEAHAHGVVHRDLKPANVILRPGGEPVVTDFGLARRGDDRGSEGLTRPGDVIGTLEYMSPEQLEGDNVAVGPRADVYALGVVLYEVLTGRRPFTGSTVRMLTAILMQPPARPSEVRPGIPPRLDDICLTAMARKPVDRYASMADFAAALTEFLRAPGSAVTPSPAARAAEAIPTPRPGQTTRPIRATAAAGPAAAPPAEPTAAPVPPASLPPSSARRSKSGSRRKKKAKTGSNRPLVIGGVAAGVVVAALATVIALRPRDESKVAHHADPTPPPAVASAPPPQPMTPPAPTGKAGPKADPPAVAKTPAAAPVKVTAPARPPAVRLRPDAVSLAVGETREVALDVQWNGYKGPLAVRWDGPPGLRVAPAGSLTLQPGEPAPKLTLRLTAEPGGGASALTVTATPDPDAKLAAATAKLTVGYTPGPCTRVIEVADRPGAADALAFTPDASLALVGVSADQPAGAKSGADAHAIRVWDLRRGEPLAPLAGHAGRVTQVVVSGDGKTALSVSADETVALWDLARGRLGSQSPKQPLPVLRAAVSPDGKSALAVYPKAILRVNLEKFQPFGQPIKTAQLTGSDLDDAVLAVALSQDRKGLVGGVDGKLFLLDLTEKAKAKPLVGHKEAVRCAAFGPGGLAATGGGGVFQVGELRPGRDNVLCAWDTAAAALKWRAEGHTAPVVCVAFNADGKRLASGGADGEVRVWDAGGKPVADFKGHAGRVLALAFTPDGAALVSGAADGTVRQWRLP
ncbi:MAG TPA: serine/threonine-protein kinase [Urbifossiella sp.]|nr:serine/threonine-protein kinase [Urbifossiella sp.]